jgi:hypothetical protein
VCADLRVARARETKKRVGARYISSLRPTIFSLVQKAIGNLTNLRGIISGPETSRNKYKYHVNRDLNPML